MTRGEEDDVLKALEQLVSVLEENVERAQQAIRRAEEIRRRRLAGHSFSDIAREQDRPLIVEITSKNQQRLNEAGSRFRQAQARALHREGMSMSDIAKLFKVTRQRVSALLRSPHP